MNENNSWLGLQWLFQTDEPGIYVRPEVMEQEIDEMRELLDEQ